MRRSSRPQPALGMAVRRVREKKGATQEAVARQAGIAIPTLSMIEGGNSNPTWATVRDIAAALGISMGELAKLADKLSSAEKRDKDETLAPRNASESPGSSRNVIRPASRASGSTKGKGRHLPALLPMRPTRIELATFGLKDRRSLVPVKGPLTTELRAPCCITLSA
jgi:transcriptional regulator with XRE-family HTH domain